MSNSSLVTLSTYDLELSFDLHPDTFNIEESLLEERHCLE